MRFVIALAVLLALGGLILLFAWMLISAIAQALPHQERRDRFGAERRIRQNLGRDV